MMELKPCPFCGGVAVIHHCGELENETMAVVYNGKVGIHCRNCNIATLPCETKNEAIEVWNRRADDGGADMRKTCDDQERLNNERLDRE